MAVAEYGDPGGPVATLQQLASDGAAAYHSVLRSFVFISRLIGVVLPRALCPC